MTSSQIITELKKHKNPKNVAGMARFGINPSNTLGIPMPFLRQYAKKIGKDHKLALELWKTGIHEARILACLIADPKLITSAQMEAWVKDFDSWDVCDQCCMNLFDKTIDPFKKAVAWSKDKREFVRRAGFALMASLALRSKPAPDEAFDNFFIAIKNNACDDRNFVKKAVNWALRQIGKRNLNLNNQAIKVSQEILKINNTTAQWIAKDALKELQTKRKSIK